MDYETLLPSEIDRLIYGYLEQENCTKTASCFLQESKNLSECQAVVSQGKHFSSKVNGFKLTNIIDSYYGIRNAVIKKMEELKSIKEHVVDADFLSNILYQFGCAPSNQKKFSKSEFEQLCPNIGNSDKNKATCDKSSHVYQNNTTKECLNSKCSIKSSNAEIITEKDDNAPSQSLVPFQPSSKNMDLSKLSMGLLNANAPEIIDELMFLKKDSSCFSAYMNHSCNKYFSLESIALQSPINTEKAPFFDERIDLVHEFEEFKSLATNQMKRSSSMDSLMFDVAEEYVIAEDSKLNKLSPSCKLLSDDKSSRSNESSFLDLGSQNVSVQQPLDNLLNGIQKNTNMSTNKIIVQKSTSHWNEQNAKKCLPQSSKNEKEKVNLSSDRDLELHENSVPGENAISIKNNESSYIEKNHSKNEFSTSLTGLMESNCEIKRLEIIRKIKQNSLLRSSFLKNVYKTQKSVDGYVYNYEIQLEDGKFIEKSYVCLKALSPSRKRFKRELIVRRTPSVNLTNSENEVQTLEIKIQTPEKRMQISTLDFIKSTYQHKYNCLPNLNNNNIQHPNLHTIPVPNEIKPHDKLLISDSAVKNKQFSENSNLTGASKNQCREAKKLNASFEVQDGRVMRTRRIRTATSKLPKILITKSNITKEYQISNKVGRQTRNSSAKNKFNDNPDFQQNKLGKLRKILPKT